MKLKVQKKANPKWRMSMLSKTLKINDSEIWTTSPLGPHGYYY